MRGLLINFGIKNEEIVECIVKKKKEVSAYITSKNKAERVKNRLKEIDLKNVYIKVNTVSHKDWSEKWKNDRSVPRYHS